MLGRPSAGGHELLEDRNRGVGVDAALTAHGERLAGVLVDDVEELEDATVLGLVELEVERPDLVGSLGLQALGRHGRLSDSLSLSPPPGDPQALLAPQALDALAVEAEALLEQAGMGAAIAPARALA